MSAGDNILDKINITESVAVGAVGGALHYLFIDDNVESSLKVGAGVGLASAISDWLASMKSVQDSLGSFLSSMLKPVLVGGVSVAMVALSGGDLSDLEALAMAFGFGFVSKMGGDYTAGIYESWKRQGKKPPPPTTPQVPQAQAQKANSRAQIPASVMYQ